MKYIITPFSQEQIIKNNNYEIINGYLFGLKNYAIRFTNYFSIEELKEIKKITNKKIFIAINKFIFESELDELLKILKQLEEIEIDGIYFSDLAILNLVNKNNININLVYATETTITNKYFLKFANDNKIRGLDLAKEITFDEIKEIINNSKNIDINMTIHGNLYMYYSYRKLITNYFNYKEKENNKEQFYLYNEERNDYYPIIEETNGTSVISSYDICLIDKLDEINQLNVLCKIDGYLYNCEEYEQIIEIYNNAYNDLVNDENKYQENKEKYLEEITKINPNKKYNKGFYSKKTIY